MVPKTVNEDEKILIEQVREGKEFAFAALYDRYVDRIFGYLSSLLRDDNLAEDITQTCFMYIWEHRSILSSEKSLSSYLYKMARNYAYKHLRSRLTATRYRNSTSVTMNKAAPPADEKIDMDIIRQEAWKVINALPESRRAIYRMFTEEQLSVKEIAERLDISPKTVETQIFRARKALKTVLGPLSAFLILLYLFT
ncbi:MAG: RNA polymerase sigma-70 factor [Bacteroidales bacterium]|nr:RNA polymerase sigma-70 factor [Bacteroidales bacterium]